MRITEENEMNRKSILFSVLVVAAMILSACQTAIQATQVPTTTPAAKKVVTLIWTQEFDTLNPLYTQMWFVTVLFPVYSCQAWWYDENNNPIPNLVTEIPSSENGGISADGRTITLKLREDIVWSDKTPITSADFKFTYDMELAEKNIVTSRSPYDLITAFETPDERTVVATFENPYAPWLSSLFAGSAGIAILPAHVLQPVFDAEGTIDTADWNKAPTVGCGPFVFDEWQSGSFARFVANDNYWLGRPKLDELFFRFVPDDASMIAALVAGDGDVGTFFAYSDLPQLEAAGITIMNSFSGYNEGIYFNLHPEKGNPALKDIRVRQAIIYAFNRQKLVDDLLLGRTKVAATDWDSTPWVDPTISPYPFDPEKAKALLAEAGWTDTNGDGTVDKDGVELVLKWGTTTREVRQSTQAVGQQDLAAVGIGTELSNYEFDFFFADYKNDGPSSNFSLDFIEFSDSPNFPDPDTSRWRCKEIPSDENPVGINNPGLCDDKLEALFVKQESQVDFTARQQTFYEITKYIVDQAYYMGIWQDPDLFGFSNRMINVKMSGATAFFNVAEWDVTK